MLPIILLLLICAIAWLGWRAYQQADLFCIQRSAQIAAAPEAIYAQIIDFHRWQGWSPWAAKDPNATLTYGPTTSGVGAWLHWAGNRQVGVGRMEIIEAIPHDQIKIQLDFEKPFTAHNQAHFTLVNHGAYTEVTWAMFGKNNWIGKIMNSLIDCDAMVGKDFATGLDNLKKVTTTPTSSSQDVV